MQPEVEEIPDAEHELLVARVAAIDVAKASGKVCVRLPGRAGRRVSRVWDVAATSGAVTELAEHLVEPERLRAYEQAGVDLIVERTRDAIRSAAARR